MLHVKRKYIRERSLINATWVCRPCILYLPHPCVLSPCQDTGGPVALASWTSLPPCLLPRTGHVKGPVTPLSFDPVLNMWSKEQFTIVFDPVISCGETYKCRHVATKVLSPTRTDWQGISLSSKQFTGREYICTWAQRCDITHTCRHSHPRNTQTSKPSCYTHRL